MSALGEGFLSQPAAERQADSVVAALLAAGVPLAEAQAAARRIFTVVSSQGTAGLSERKADRLVAKVMDVAMGYARAGWPTGRAS